MKVRMFQGSYLKSYFQFLTSDGGKALRREVMPGYYLIVALILFFIYMEKPPLNISIYLLLGLLGLPIFALCLNFFTISARAYAASKRNVCIGNKIITITNIEGNFKRDFSEMSIRYFVGSYIDFIDKTNILNGYALFGDKDFLESVISILKDNGFTIVQFPTP